MLVATFVISLATLVALMDRELLLFDEGIVLSDAMRVAAGEVIHRDFYSIYGPGSYYVIAGLFRLFDARFFAARGFGLVVMASITTLATAILWRRVRPWLVVLVTLACLLTLAATTSYLYPLLPCLLLALATSHLLVGHRAADRPAVSCLAGALTGLCALFRYDVGFLLGLATCVSLLVLASGPATAGGAARQRGRALLAYALGTASVFVPAALLYASIAPLSAFNADVVEYGSRYYASMRGLPFPGPADGLRLLGELTVYLPLFAVALAAATLARLPDDGSASDAWERRCLIVFGLLAVALFAKGVVRVSTTHLVAAIVPGLILIAVCAQRWMRWSDSRSTGSRSTRSRGIAIGAALVLLYPAAIGAAKLALLYVPDPSRSLVGWLASESDRRDAAATAGNPCGEPKALFGARRAAPFGAVAAYLRAASEPGERILVGLRRHDRIYVNATALYFFADRLPATHWNQFDPGIQTRDDVQTAMVAELEAQQTRWVVRDGSTEDHEEPNGSRFSSGVHRLDRYLDARYRKVAEAGRVGIWLRNGIAAPQVEPAPAGCPWVRVAAEPRP